MAHDVRRVDWDLSSQQRWDAEGVWAPGEFTATLDGPHLTYVYRLRIGWEHGRPVCLALAAERRPGGPPVTNTSLRPPIARWLHEAAEMVLTEVTGPPNPSVIASVAGELKRSERRATDRDAVMTAVVAAYRKCVDAGHPTPRKAAAERLGYSSSYVGRLLVEARQRGFLGAATPGKAGELPAKKSTKRKGSKR